MWKNNEIFRRSIETAINHRERAAEGKRLLAEGKSLNEMVIEITGLSEAETLERRSEYLDFLDRKTSEQLSELLEIIEFQIQKRSETEEQGTSELHWQRIVILDKLEK